MSVMLDMLRMAAFCAMAESEGAGMLIDGYLDSREEAMKK